MADNSASGEPGAQRYISNPRFHRTFTLPATAEHGDLTFGYADLGRAPVAANAGPSPPAVLFMSGMFASRYLGIAMHAIAEKLGVRLLVVDRPGMGKSTDVPLAQRIPAWIELVPRLLEHLGIQHVALMSHSAGTLYLLNTLHQCRGILHPKRPFVALLAPWVHPNFSRVTTMQLAQYVPVPAFSAWNLIPQFFVTKASPAFASSGTVFNKASSFISGVGPSEDSSWLEKNRRKIESDYGTPRDLQAEIEDEVVKCMFGENTVGANGETLQLLRKGQDWTWAKCDDYSTCVREVVEKERTLSHDSNSKQKLKVIAFFAYEDKLVGKKGQNYMEECWRGKNAGEFEDVVDFESITVPETDHDNVMRSVETLESIFINAGGIKTT